MMKLIEIEWMHLDVSGETCVRCADTGDAVQRAIEELNRECGDAGIRVRLKETRLDAGRIDESNRILVNGRPIEAILPEMELSASDCSSCGELIGEATQCRSLVVDGQEYEAVPPARIREAVCRVGGCC